MWTDLLDILPTFSVEWMEKNNIRKKKKKLQNKAEKAAKIAVILLQILHVHL
jgi:uncharacterized membrane protein